MKTGTAAALLFAVSCAASTAAMAQPSGKQMFTQHCAACHPDGGNVINPKKTLHRKDMAANGVRTAADIVRIMRNPGPGMTKFDAATVPDKEATAIANYILKAFK